MKRVKKLVEQLKNHLEIYLVKCLKQSQLDNDIIGLGIFTDTDMSSFVVCINTEHHLVEKNSKADSDNKKLTNKWWLPEWYWESSDSDEDIKHMMVILNSIYERLEHYDFKRTLFAAYCDTLANFKDLEQIDLNEQLMLMVQESDNFIAEIDKQDLSKLLTDDQWNEYLKFNEYWIG